jgi:hypothetical protein
MGGFRLFGFKRTVVDSRFFGVAEILSDPTDKKIRKIGVR